jgi:AraC-like DNA-binding protein
MAANLVSVSRLRTDRQWALQAHAHPFWEMLVFVAGRHWVEVEGREDWSGPGDVLLFRPGQRHRERTGGEGQTEWLCLAFDWPRGEPLPGRGHDRTGRIRLLAEWLLSERQSLSPTAGHLRDALLGALLAEFRETFQTRGHAMVERVRQHVREHLSARLRLSDLSLVAGLSRFHFVREFHRLAGRTPMADVRLLRLDHARDLLVSSTLPLKSIAERCGLGDEHSLCRLFRRHVGVSPGSLRAYERRGNGPDG